MVEQLEAQDPLDPLDAQDFSAQLAQFSSLEQMTNVNENLEKLQDLQLALANTAALDLIDKSVDAPGDRFVFTEGESQSLSYSLDSAAAQVEIDIFDENGKRVTTLTPGAQSSGSNQAIWNGVDGDGEPVEDGVFTFRVRAEDLSGNTVPVETFVQGKVTDVIFEDGKTFAMVNGQKINIENIQRVSSHQ